MIKIQSSKYNPDFLENRINIFLKAIRAKGKFDEASVNKVIQGLSKNLNLPKVSSSDEAKDLFAHVNNDLNDFTKCMKLEKVCLDK